MLIQKPRPASSRTVGGNLRLPSISPSIILLLSHVVLALGLWSAFRRREQRLYDLAYRDALTGLPNRRALEQALSHPRRDRPELLLSFIDIDGLKVVNDTLGHAAGDDLLRTFAHQLGSAVADRGQVYRLSGDEFALLLDRGEPEAVVRLVAEVTRCVQEVYPGAGASVGTARRQPGETAGNWLARADRAMYIAKRRASGGCWRSQVSNGEVGSWTTSP